MDLSLLITGNLMSPNIGGYSHPEGINVAETVYLFFKRFFDGLLKILPNRITVSILGSFSQIVDIFDSMGFILYI